MTGEEDIVCDIENALDACLTALLTDEDQRRDAKALRLRSSLEEPLLQTLSFGDATGSPARDAAFIKGLASDPVQYALLAEITRLGERLFLIGGQELMRRALKRIVQRSGGRPHRRQDTLSRRWNGIGHWIAGAE